MAEHRSNPFRGIFDTFAEMHRMREQIGHPDQAPDPHPHASAWVPRVDIFAEGQDIVIRCELAGVRHGDVALSLSGGQLCISGIRRDDPHESGAVSYYVRERRYGPFRRTLGVPQHVDAERISAAFADGLLEVRLLGGARGEEERRIEIGGATAEPIRVGVGVADAPR